MPREKIIITDADGVLINWNDAFDRFMTSKGYTLTPGGESEYKISVRYNILSDLAMQYVKEFNEGPMIADLEPFADSVEYVKRLTMLGFRFIVVTSISSAPQAKVYRESNLKSIFGNIFIDVHCLEQGSSKAEMLSRWSGKEYFWIEDRMRQAEAGHEAGLKTVLINHPYNKHYETDLFPRVSYETPWKEIYEMVCKEYSIEV